MRDADVAVTDDVRAQAEAFRNEKEGNVFAIIAAFACQFNYDGLFVADIARGGFFSGGFLHATLSVMVHKRFKHTSGTNLQLGRMFAAGVAEISRGVTPINLIRAVAEKARAL